MVGSRSQEKGSVSNELRNPQEWLLGAESFAGFGAHGSSDQYSDVRPNGAAHVPVQLPGGGKHKESGDIVSFLLPCNDLMS